MVETQEKMLHIGTNESGCVSEADIAELVDRERKKPLRRRARITLARSLVPSNVRLLYNSMRCPKEVYAATVVADRDVLVAPLPKPADVDWASLVLLDPPSFSHALDTLTNAMLTQTTHAAHATLGLGDHAPGRNSLLMYLAQQGDVDQVRDIFATRPIVRSIVDLRNTLGYAAIDYALANDHQEVYDIFLSYHREHLAHHSINSKLRHNLDNGGSRFAARGGRWELRE
ncbi:hypothetical protein JL722_13339 [Aureococcus anophagefferens]|nr:hypothetical protein JL722_13339 [Aureococcus anophagefferens]